MNIPYWVFILACVYMSLGIIDRIIMLREKIICTSWWMNRNKWVKWPSIRFKRPRWMSFNKGLNHMNVQSNASHDDFKECKGCGGATRLLVDGLCVGCRRD